VKARQSGYLLIHVVNASQQPIKVHGTVEGVGYAPGTAVTQAQSYVTFNGNISVSAQGAANAVSSCDVPAGAKFSWMSTLSRKLSTQTYLKDGASVLFQSTDSTNPGSRIDDHAPFATFATNKATVECDFTNATNATVTTGDTPDNETCMMLAYHFPATKPRLCANDVLFP
jgi:hypothetical protein